MTIQGMGTFIRCTVSPSALINSKNIGMKWRSVWVNVLRYNDLIMVANTSQESPRNTYLEEGLHPSCLHLKWCSRKKEYDYYVYG